MPITASPTFRTEKTCADCGEPFLPTGGNQRYCTDCGPGHEAPHVQMRRKLDRIAGLAADADKMSPAMLRIRIQAIHEGVELPAEEGAFLNLATRAGVSYRDRNMAWRQNAASMSPDPLTADRLAEALAKASSLPTSEHPRTTALYRWFDDVDILLYAGISDGLPGRVYDHVSGSSWMEFAVRATIERFPSRDEALAAETAAIHAEGPLFNSLHNTPEMKLCLVEYLIEHDRLDLLAPAVSRG